MNGDQPAPPHVSTEARGRRPNLLAGEKSPYLLQHQFNPVAWHPWGEPAFQRAREEKKPIFLSIGYSTCHWCHVMERESFEDERTAELLNRHFISIKVDREERPDIDRVYMAFVQSTTGQGGWPLSAFLTPELRPFFGATYFPPEPRHGRPSFRQILEQIHHLWDHRRPDLARSATEMLAKLETAGLAPAAPGVSPGFEVIEAAVASLREAYDPVHGGFGGAPKFPQPSQPALLLRYAARTGDPTALSQVLHTCDQMAAGGIHDHLGGGFARYSVDEQWLVPHFEKMLYDNAQLAQLYLDAATLTGAPHHAAVARDILDYVIRDMTNPEGGFASAEDADSEGHEGKFYCWTRTELAALLTPSEFATVCRCWGVTDGGNFVDHSHPSPLAGQNVLSLVEAPGTVAGQADLASARGKMIAARAGRLRPHRDDKVLASWNGLMLGAMSRAAAVFDDASYRAAADANLTFLRGRLWDPAFRTLHHRWREGERDTVQLLPAYAFLLAGVIDHYEATLAPGSLEFAVSLGEALLERFFDPGSGGFWQTLPGAPDLILHLKDDYDGAEPSGNSVATHSLLRLGSITGRPEFSTAAQRTLDWFSDRLHRFPQALPALLAALDFSLQEPVRIVITGDPADERVRPFLSATHSVFLPNKVVTGTQGPVEPFARTLPAAAGVVAYVCEGTYCHAPVASSGSLRALLGDLAARRTAPGG